MKDIELSFRFKYVFLIIAYSSKQELPKHRKQIPTSLALSNIAGSTKNQS
jgi:hypothetical protein